MKLKTLFKKPYVFWVLGISLLYIALTVILSKFYVTLSYVPYFLDTLNWFDLLSSILFTVALGFFVALNSVATYLQYKEAKEQKACSIDNNPATKNRKATTVTAIGLFGGIATGVCSVCAPALFGFFGIAASIATLPFQGFEIQAGLLLLLGANLYYLKNPISSLRSEGIFNKKDKEREVKE